MRPPHRRTTFADVRVHVLGVLGDRRRARGGKGRPAIVGGLPGMPRVPPLANHAFARDAADKPPLGLSAKVAALAVGPAWMALHLPRSALAPMPVLTAMAASAALAYVQVATDGARDEEASSKPVTPSRAEAGAIERDAAGRWHARHVASRTRGRRRRPETAATA